MNKHAENCDRDQQTPDQKAAHQFLTELRTRITTQPLPYQYGVEARALESLWEVFAQAREAIKSNPGCEQFARDVTRVLNVHLRPVTAKWHRAHEQGRLHARDGADEFRGDLAQAQRTLQAFASELHEMAYGRPYTDETTPEPMTKAELDANFAQLPFGIPEDCQIDKTIAGQINESEAAELQQRRANCGVTTERGIDAVGLALSGGGIRSASFCLGVVQVLADRKLLNQVDFLSTVSGGGYTGSFLTRRLDGGADQGAVAHPHGPDPDSIRYLRQHAKFLPARTLREAWAMVCATFGGMLLNWAAPLSVILAAALAIAFLDPRSGDPGWPVAVSLFGALCAATLIAYGYSLRFGRYAAQVNGGTLGVVTALTALIALCWAAVGGYEAFKDWVTHSWQQAGAAAALIAAAPAMIRFLPVLQKPAVRKIALQVLLWAAALIVPLLALTVFYAGWWVAAGTPENLPANIPGWWLIAGAAPLSAGIALWVLNINLTGPHRMYRDGLAQTFVQRTQNDDPVVPLAQINTARSAPYHLINCNVNLPSSEHVALRERRGDFFLFSKYWSGSAATGYFTTERWKASGEPLDLATAMATSGAAFSSHMGLGAMPTLTAVMSLLNVRLGFWIKQPNIGTGSEHPGFTCLLREMFGVGMCEKADWLNLSDGGHIENMAVYELLRRRCKFIICVDGEADPEFTFGGLMTLVRHAQIDFGVRINPALQDIRPDATTRLSKTHFQFCRIHYPAIGGKPPGTGFLLYLKLSVTGNEPELIRRYRGAHPDFPHQTTLDQFFDEEQFEAYRQLGVHVAEGLFSTALMNPGGQPPTIPMWFRQLAGNLLLPN